MPGIASFVASLSLVVASPPQEDGLSRASAAMLDAVGAKAAEAPDSLDRPVIERIAVFGNSRALDVLLTALAGAERASVRVDVLRSLREFAAGAEQQRALESLERAVREAGTASECEMACRSLELFGAAGLARLRVLGADAAAFHSRLFACESVVRLAEAEDFPGLRALARDERRAEWRRLGFPEDDPAWAERASLLRCAALEAALRLEPERLDLPSSLLQERDHRVQATALRLLGAEGDRRAVTRAHVVFELEEPPPELLRAALFVLSRHQTDASIARLLHLARGGPLELQVEALDALAAMDPERLLPELLSLCQATGPRADALVAVDLLSRQGSVAALAGLERLVQHRESMVKCAALRALGENEARDAVPTVRAKLSSRDLHVRAAAIVALSRLMPIDLDWRQEVVELAGHHKFPVRLAATEALRFFGDRSVLPTLRQLAEDSDWRIRHAALAGFRRIRASSSVPFLIERLQRERSRLRREIADCLRHITGAPLGDGADEWTRWWRDQGSLFVVPTLAEVERLERERSRRAAQTRTASSFYGIPVISDHLAVVVDVSGSMSTPATDAREDEPGATRLSIAQRETLDMLSRVPRNTQVQIVWFSSKAQSWKRELTPLGRDNVRDAARVVRSWRAAGHTNLYDALDSALEDPRVDTVYLLSDGYPTNGKIVDPLALRQDLKRRNASGAVTFHTISVGMESELMRWIAEDSGGTSVTRL